MHRLLHLLCLKSDLEIEAESDLSGKSERAVWVGWGGYTAPPRAVRLNLAASQQPGLRESLLCSLLGCSNQPLASLLGSKQGGTWRKPALAWQAFKVPLWSFCGLVHA